MKENVLERNARMDTDRKIADFRVKQQMDYAFKMKYARIRAWEFYNHPDVAGNCYVAVGGLDSITLLLFLRSIGIDVPAVSVSSLEDKSIQRVHKQLGVQPEQLHPLRIVLFLGKLLHNGRGQTRLQFVSVLLVVPNVVNAAVNIRNIGLLVHAYASRPVCS